MKELLGDNRNNHLLLLLANSATQAKVCATLLKFQGPNPAIKQDGRLLTVESKKGQRLENYHHLQETQLS